MGLVTSAPERMNQQKTSIIMIRHMFTRQLAINKTLWGLKEKRWTASVWSRKNTACGDGQSTEYKEERKLCAHGKGGWVGVSAYVMWEMLSLSLSLSIPLSLSPCLCVFHCVSECINAYIVFSFVCVCVWVWVCVWLGQRCVCVCVWLGCASVCVCHVLTHLT